MSDNTFCKSFSKWFFSFFFCIDQDLRIWCSVHGAMGRCKVGNRGTILYASMHGTLHHVLNLAILKLLMPIPSSTFILIKVPWIVLIWLIKRGKFFVGPYLWFDKWNAGTNELSEDDLGIVMVGTCNPQFATEASRLESYKNKWPCHLTQTPDVLSCAGFFYTGKF